MKRRRSYLPLFSLLLCVAAAWAYLAPYAAYRKLQRAAERGDVAALNEVVDFPALRTSVKENVKTAVSREISTDGRNPLAAVGGAVAGLLVNPLVDAVVTPAGISALTDGRDPRRGDDAPREEEPRLERDRGYESVNRFVVRYREPESGEERVALVLRRDGLGWKLAGVRFGRPAP